MNGAASEVRLTDAPRTSPGGQTLLRLSVDQVRRLNLIAQRLAGPRPPHGTEGILDVAQRLRRIQIDPTNAVARSQLLVLWSRLGAYDASELDRLLWNESALFEYDAYIVPMQDHPIYAASAAGTPFGDTKRARDVREWLADNDDLRHDLLAALEERGQLATGDFEAAPARAWRSSGWSDERSIGRMLELLARKGEMIVAGRRGRERLWDLPDRVVPEHLRAPLPLSEALNARIEQSVRARGAMPQPPPAPYSAAPPPFGGLPREPVEAEIARLVEAGRLVRCEVLGPDGPLRGSWVVHADMLGLVESIADRMPDARPPCCPRSTTSSSTGIGRTSCSASTTRWRSTCRRGSASTAIGSCPSCMAIG